MALWFQLIWNSVLPESGCCFLSHIRNFQPLFLQIIFLPSLLLWDSVMGMLFHLLFQGLLVHLHLLKFFVILLVCLGDFHCFVLASLFLLLPNQSVVNSSSVFFSSVITSLWYFLLFPLSLLKFSLCSTILLPNLMSNFMIIIELCQETAYLSVSFISFLRFYLIPSFGTYPLVSLFCLIMLFYVGKSTVSPSLEGVALFKTCPSGSEAQHCFPPNLEFKGLPELFGLCVPSSFSRLWLWVELVQTGSSAQSKHSLRLEAPSRADTLA